MKIQEFINNKHKYKVDMTYQRPVGAWSNEDNQCLIDTILRNEPMPLFFLNYKTNEGVYYIVDGQQRFHAIQKFYDNSISLNKKFSDNENHNKTFNGDNAISDELREKFLSYNLNINIIEDYDDEKVRLIFSRLQRGKPLTLGERLNAKPGEIVLRMREIAEHPFMKRSIGIVKSRFGNYPDAARILFYEKYGCRDSGTPALMNFFDESIMLSKNDREYKNAITTLNILEKCFPVIPGDYQFLNKHAWVSAVYMMIRDLNIGYSLIGEEDKIKRFVETFHNHVYTEDFRNSIFNYQKFYDNVRGGWSEKILTLRRDILIKEFENKYPLKTTDERRQISDEEKIECFSKQHVCQECGREFKDYKEPEYHHKIRYADGGQSEINNILVLCSKCHDEIHGKKEFKPSNEVEIEEDENNE